MEQSDRFPVAFKPVLKEYLAHCDMVKYAHVEPGDEEIQNIFDNTKKFILSTEETVKGS